MSQPFLLPKEVLQLLRFPCRILRSLNLLLLLSRYLRIRFWNLLRKPALLRKLNLERNQHPDEAEDDLLAERTSPNLVQTARLTLHALIIARNAKQVPHVNSTLQDKGVLNALELVHAMLTLNKIYKYDRGKASFSLSLALILA